MMQLLVEANQGLSRTQRTLMSARQRLTVGSSVRSDLCVESDKDLHQVHFQLVGTEYEFRVRTNPAAGIVSLNGQPITESLVRNGDTIVAGSTTFRLTVRGQSTDPGEKSRRHWEITERETDSQIFATTCEGISVANLPDALRHVHVDLVLHRQHHKLYCDGPAAIELIADPQFGSVLVPGPDEDTKAILPDVVKSGTAVALLNSKPCENGRRIVQNMLGLFCDADLLRHQLENGPPVYASHIVSDVYGILMNHPEEPHWTIYSAASIRESLKRDN